MCIENNKKLHVNLGCGDKEMKSEGDIVWVNIDKGDYGFNVIRDIRNGLPFCDNSVDYIIADNVLEHIEPNESFIYLMNECLRVLKPEAKFHILVPYWASKVMYKDPTHVRFFSEETFFFFCKENTWQYGFDKRWEVEKTERLSNHTDIMEVILIAKK